MIATNDCGGGGCLRVHAWSGVGVPSISCMAPPPQEEEVELRRMSVASSARGLGLGKRLVARVEQHARECGFQAVRQQLITVACVPVLSGAFLSVERVVFVS
eukprot:COSAG01_NODE_2323_length_7908_cov_43.508388_3_plen_102_part_00